MQYEIFKTIIAYFNGLGVALSHENERVYPSSFQANSVLDALRDKLEYLKTDIKVGEGVKSVEKVGKNFQKLQCFSTNNKKMYQKLYIVSPDLQK